MVCDTSCQPRHVYHLVVYEIDEKGFGIGTDFGLELFFVSLNGEPLFSSIQAGLCFDVTGLPFLGSISLYCRY